MNDYSSLIASLVTPGLLPPAIDPDFCRRTQPDCAAMDDETVFAHFRAWGSSEGRCASPAALRAGFLACIDPGKACLEIGPAVRPALRGPNVKYFEIADRAGLIERAQREGYDYGACPDTIHFVSPTADLAIVDESFATVFSNHCIEYQPDLVRHLRDVETLIEPGGAYFLIVPDKRYCFDALLPASRLHQVLRAHEERRTVHTFEKVLEHRAMTTHNDAARHWNGDHLDAAYLTSIEARARFAEDEFASARGAISTCTLGSSP